MLQTGQAAPLFTAPDQTNTAVALVDFQGKNRVVVYFYPKDDTPGCTIEANQFSALSEEFARHDTVVLGVSKDSCTSHQKFIDKYGLKVHLLSDADGKMCEDYGVWQDKEKDGVKKKGIVRSTFVIDKNGMLTYVKYGVTADGHAQQILNHISGID